MPAHTYLNQITSSRWPAARAERKKIAQTAKSIVSREDLLAQTATILFCAGAGSRWQRSVVEAQAHGSGLDIDPEKPRCLAPVPDILDPGKKVLIGVYDARAIKGIGQPVIVWRTHLIEIEEMAKTAGLENPFYFQQPAPLGHGDALKNLLPTLSPSIKYLITLFACGTPSAATMTTSLLVLAALQKAEEDLRPWALMPTTQMVRPTYPILVDELGSPVYFGHDKLIGTQIGLPADRPLQGNIGIRLYHRPDLSEPLKYFARYHLPGSGYNIPGNQTNEFALDNIDQRIAQNRHLRLLCIARPEEIVPVKKLEDIEAYLAAQRILQNSEIF